MADVKISALPVASALAATDVLPMVQPSGTVKVAMSVLDSRWLSSATGGTVDGGLTVNGGLTANPYLAVGTNPAQTGTVRLPHAGFVYGRNAANVGDVPVIGVNTVGGADYVQIGPGASGVAIPAGSAKTLWVNSSSNPVASTGGIVFGSSGDTNLYRNGAGLLKTDGSVAIGTNPATTGIVRLPNNQWVSARNAANTADMPMLMTSSSNQTHLNGTALVAITLGGAGVATFSPTLATSTQPIALGTNPAASGIIRIPNDQPITARNAANNADVPMLKVSTAGTVQYWNGTAWADIAGGGGGTAPGTELFYGQRTAFLTITATTEATAQEVVAGSALTYDGTPIWVEFFCPNAQTATAAQIQYALWDATTNTGRLGTSGAGGISGQPCVPVYVKRKFTPTAGSHTFRICASGVGSPVLQAGTGATATTDPPSWMRITKA